MQKRKLTFKFLCGCLTTLLLLKGVFLPVAAITIDIPTPPPIPSAPAVPGLPVTFVVPVKPQVPSLPVAPTPPAVPTISTVGDPVVVPTPPPTPRLFVSPTPTPSPAVEVVETTVTPPNIGGNEVQMVSQANDASAVGGQSDSFAVGDPVIKTGDAYTVGTTINYLNTNAAGQSTGSDEIVVENRENGVDSVNSGSITVSSDDFTIQNNDANLTNDASLTSNSGENTTSFNVGDSTIISGDAATTATAINVVNTNLDGVAVAEFNIDDTHTGDLVLNFPEIAGCSGVVNCVTNGSLSATNTQNGADSTNTADIILSDNSTVFQNNNADVVNNLVVSANTGNNESSFNTAGSSTIKTGDASVVATVGNFVNNNISGDGRVMIGVVNIFGDLFGNIVLPQEAIVSPLADTQNIVSPLADSQLSATNSGNGESSTNTTNIDTSKTTTISQTNDVNIDNTLNVLSTTGDNETSFNTASFSNADNVIQTGDATIDVNVVNIANTNKTGGDTWWLVFINDVAGNWVGKILGAPEGATMAGSNGTEFTTTADGAITVRNTDNGAGSTNTSSVSNSQTTTIIQNNSANITNNLTLSANTGGNEASFNTGGDNYIKTGNANVMANLVNFVNNNFVGSNVVVTVVNVFGSWLGSFVSPEYQASSSEQNNSDSTNQNSQPNTVPDNTGGSQIKESITDTALTKAETPPLETTGVVTDATTALAANTSQKAETAGIYTIKDNILEKDTRGRITEDNSITIPSVKQIPPALSVSHRQILPFWFWILFFTLAGIWVLKKIYVYAHNEKSYYQNSFTV